MQRNITQFIKYGITGITNTAVDFGVFIFSCLVLHTSRPAGQAIGYMCGTINSYLLNRRWVFGLHHGGKANLQEVIKFAISNSITMGASVLIIKLYSSDSLIIAKVLATATTTILNFLLYKFWVFRQDRFLLKVRHQQS